MRYTPSGGKALDRDVYKDNICAPMKIEKMEADQEEIINGLKLVE